MIPIVLNGQYAPGYKGGGPIQSCINMVENLYDQFDFYVLCADRDYKETEPYSDIKINQWNEVGHAKVYYLSPDKQDLKEKNLTNAEKKRMESLDKRIEKIQNKIAVNRKEYDAMTEELQKLLEERYPERRPEKIKTTLYEAYSHSDRSLDDILAFIEGRDDDIDW